ncbi:MAG: hypothetical protein GF335_02620 [Candidatus Moranbacteria bacterium]|nr:hypothetical protein [Candidatus Moranbacteria bacterium]
MNHNFLSPYENQGSVYPILLIPAIMWVISQILKFSIYSYKHGVNWKYLFEYGHMPSSHTSSVTALMFTIGYYEGIFSPAFAIAFTMGMIIIFDAVKLRGYIGSYGKILNKLIKDAGFKNKYPRLKERVGHSISEVLSGVVLGITGSLLLIYIFEKLF